jgi:hypothetical protein
VLKSLKCGCSFALVRVFVCGTSSRVLAVALTLAQANLHRRFREWAASFFPSLLACQFLLVSAQNSKSNVNCAGSIEYYSRHSGCSLSRATVLDL